jgi:hypothetical protein
MGYLIRNDYKGLIQVDNLTAIIGNDSNVLTANESRAIEEVSSYLRNRFDVAQEFTDTALYAYGTTRSAKNRVYLDATAYSATSTYALNSLVLYNGYIYRCSTAVTVAEAWNAAKWTVIGQQYAIFYVKLPYDEFVYETQYSTGDTVWYNDKTYIATHDTLGEFPDKTPSTWGSGTTYTVAGSVWPTDTSKWTAGDNRSPQILGYLIDIVLYHIHSRIAPMNIPSLRVKRYDDAISWLKKANISTDITASIPKIHPKTSARILWGSTLPKQDNNF